VAPDHLAEKVPRSRTIRQAENFAESTLELNALDAMRDAHHPHRGQRTYAGRSRHPDLLEVHVEVAEANAGLGRTMVHGTVQRPQRGFRLLRVIRVRAQPFASTFWSWKTTRSC
jgi:hypothetical protein